MTAYFESWVISNSLRVRTNGCIIGRSFMSVCGLTHVRCTTVADCARTVCTDLAQAVQLHLNRPAQPSVSTFCTVQVFQCFLSPSLCTTQQQLVCLSLCRHSLSGLTQFWCASSRPLDRTVGNTRGVASSFAPIRN
jgi:hypothetical protein